MRFAGKHIRSPLQRRVMPPVHRAVAGVGRPARPAAPALILLLHNRYRMPGGEERAVEDLAWLVRTELGEEAEVLERDSARARRGRAAPGLLRGGLEPETSPRAVRRTGARVVHAHNVQPALGWRALAAARTAGARVVLHLHNYRLVCAVGICFTHGEDCTRCHGRNTCPGVRLNCRGGSRAEAAAYGAGLASGSGGSPGRRRVRGAERVRARAAARLGAPLGGRARVIPSVQRAFAERSRAGAGTYALVAGRLAPEKGVADAVAACRAAGVPLVVAGEGPQAAELRALRPAPTCGSPAASRPAAGRAARAAPALALVPSRYAEILPLAAAEAMAAGLPVVASRAGGLAEFVPEAGLSRRATRRRWRRASPRCWATRRRARPLWPARASARAVVAGALREVYGPA